MSSIAAFSFGALGDFVALLDLSKKVRKSLNASSGASQDYLMFLFEVDSLVRVLQMATPATTPARLSQLSPALIQEGLSALKSVQNIMTDLETKITTYQEKLRKGGSRRMMMESWRKIGWGLLVQDDEVAKLRRQLVSNVRTMGIVTSSAQCAGIDELQQQSWVVHDRLTKILTKSVGYTWEGGMTAETAPIQLRDMFDNIISIPSEFCATPERLEGLLNVYLRGRKGTKSFLKGDYELTISGCGTELDLIDPAQWTRIVKPGIFVEMNAIIRRKSRPNNHSDLECPCCRRIVVSVKADTLSICPHCDSSFIVSRTDVDDPTNLDGPHDVPELVPGQRSAYNLLGELEIIYGQKDWRAQHIAQLEDVYTESQCLRHVRVLEWLPIRHARSMSRTEVGYPLPYRDSTNKEVTVFWKGPRTLSNVPVSLTSYLEFPCLLARRQGVVMHEVVSEETGSVVSLLPAALIHSFKALTMQGCAYIGYNAWSPDD
ncbi:uncharacterized protein STEHIDRAFT_125284 [Stereum hirsutum FP-91666 SS1]|uniref:uncharacterized protein n=1 Tax=Stereum hirsutum (strain FP-91666) TaxID=721885 RepID=UPI000444A34E|nr:uncharacterized protein STEHIDRAFT_125284 [Stereum hirsutum FP-91666 SS1]EIM80978.1 hypothetical protein STEHIDRAFT_125284 [Stereum hirsutum FP-91666 SS1]